MACPTGRHRFANQSWPSNDSLTGVTAVSRSALARHAGSTATTTTLNPDEPILCFGGLRAVIAACWVWTDSVFELGRRERQHNPGRPHRAPQRSDRWGRSLPQVLSLPLLVHHHCSALQAMDRSRRLVQNNSLKMLAVLGLLLGINALGLLGATLGLLLSLPFSAFVLMA